MRDGQCKSGECNILFECVKKRKKKDDGCKKTSTVAKANGAMAGSGKEPMSGEEKLGKRCARDGQCKSGQCNWK